VTDREAEILAEAATAIVDWPQLWTRLLDEHTAGPDGRCLACPSALCVAPRWPCRITLLARTAHALHHASRAADPTGLRRSTRRPRPHRRRA